MDPVTFQPIGTIHSPFSDVVGMPVQAIAAVGVRGSIELAPEYCGGLKDREDQLPKVLVNYSLSESLRQRLLAEADESYHFVFAPDEATSLREIADAEVAFGILTPEMFAAATKLRWYQSSVASQERYMFPALIESDVQLTNMAGIYSEEIADHVYALILGLTRLIPRFVRNQDRRYWEPYRQFTPEYLMGKTIGFALWSHQTGEMLLVFERSHYRHP